MKVVHRKLSSAELDELKKQKARRARKALNDSIMLGVLALFGIMLLLLLFEKMGLSIPPAYAKPAAVGLSVVTAAVYYLSSIRRIKAQALTDKNITRYILTITDYWYQPIANTEYSTYVCRTTDNKTLIFQTSQLPADQLADTLEIELLDDRIVSVANYTTGKTINLHHPGRHSIASYDNEFYLLDTDFYNL